MASFAPESLSSFRPPYSPEVNEYYLQQVVNGSMEVIRGSKNEREWYEELNFIATEYVLLEDKMKQDGNTLPIEDEKRFKALHRLIYNCGIFIPLNELRQQLLDKNS
jgi:hypothetical protein